MYIRPVGEIIKWLNIKYHCYADDTQVYVALKPPYQWDDISYSVESCIVDIRIWMNSHMLKLNKGYIGLVFLIQATSKEN